MFQALMVYYRHKNLWLLVRLLKTNCSNGQTYSENEKNKSNKCLYTLRTNGYLTARMHEPST